MTGAGSNQSRGRILPYQREATDDVPLIGADLTLNDTHQQGVVETTDHGWKRQTVNNYRNRIKHVYEFFLEFYPDYCSQGGVRDLSQEEIDSGRHHTNKKDLVYAGLNVHLLLAFLANKKSKGEGKLHSFTGMRKYYDAILYGSKQADQLLPRSFYIETEKWMKSYRKEASVGKSKGMVEERAADPVTFTLFRLWMMWAVDSKNVFLWVFGLLQWACMARSVSIGTLAFHNFRLGDDNIICRYDRHKTSQSGESVHDKHIFSNPFDAVMDVFLALAIWFALAPLQFETREDFFRSSDTGETSASQRFNQQLSTLINKHKDESAVHIRVDHANTHSIRKGSGTYSQSGTTAPPPATATAGRGECSSGYLSRQNPCRP